MCDTYNLIRMLWIALFALSDLYKSHNKEKATEKNYFRCRKDIQKI